MAAVASPAYRYLPHNRTINETTASDDADRAPGPVRADRTVTPSYHGRPDMGMHGIGLLLCGLLLLVVLPVLPILGLVWALSKAVERLFGR